MASAFDLNNFVDILENFPSSGILDGLKRSDMFEVAKHYKITVTNSMKKADLKSVLFEYFVDEGMLDEDVKDATEGLPEPTTDSALKLKELELEIEREKRMKVEAELELARIGHGSTAGRVQGGHFDPSKHIRLIPPFQDKQIDKYFQHFENVAERLNWPSDLRTLLLQSVLTGKAQEVYSSLPVEQSSDYAIVKTAILKAYEQVPEAYRQKFRNKHKKENQTYIEFAHDKEILFDRWTTSCDANDFDNLRQLIILEEFKSCLPESVKAHLEEQQVREVHRAAVLADDYVLTHKTSFNQKNESGKRRFKGKDLHVADKPIGANAPQAGSDKKDSESDDKAPKYAKQVVKCDFCHKLGHIKPNCYSYKRQLSASKRPIALTSNAPSHFEQRLPKNSDRGSFCNVREEFLPFISEGYISLDGDDDSNQYPVVILRDTGASQSLLFEGAAPLNSKSSLGANVLITGVDATVIDLPLHRVFLKSNLVSGPITVAVTRRLPEGITGVTLILGNDVAGSKVLLNPHMTDRPSCDVSTEALENEIPGIFPSCAITRAMSKSAKTAGNENERDSDVNLSDSFMSTLNADQLSELPKCCYKVQELNAISDVFLNRKHLIDEQERDKELVELRQMALEDNEATKKAVCYVVKGGVLMRKWRPLDIPADYEWEVTYQVVVPTPYRKQVISLAHDLPVAGHLGITKTCDRILKHFFWPNLKQSVSEFCKTCHACQIAGKPNQKPPKAPLKPIPAFDEPFSKVIVDCVGPLPRTKSGNEFIFTIMCASTRYPEAIPLRSIRAKPVTDALVSFFTRFGLPKIVQSDQGTNFTSKLFKEQMSQLGIKLVTSSAYHPQSQGVLERFHQTLKSMLRIYCLEHEKDWDQGLTFVLFAIREVVNDSLGFSPFELVFGREVRGPLSLLKEKWLEEETLNSTNLVSYVVRLKERLRNAHELAQAKLKDSQDQMKAWYDRKARARTLQPGDKVLALLPVPGHSLHARYSGPYTVQRKLNDLDYVIATPDRRKTTQLCHINMLKLYCDRQADKTKSVPEKQTLVCVRQTNENEDVELPGCSARLKNSQILNKLNEKLCHLAPDQQADLSNLLYDYKHLFSDVPGRTDLIMHDVDVGSSVPSKQHPYRCSPIKQAVLQNELQYMLENNIIKESDSPWSSPCILVRKPDSSYRFCTDFRKVNLVTKSDSYPLPRIDDLIDKVGNAKFVSTYDLLKGYWQIPLTPRAQEISAFAVPQGLYCYTVLPFGMKNAPATFQRLMNQITSKLSNTQVYIDDVTVYNQTWEEHVASTRALFDKLSEAKLTVNLTKSNMGQAKVTFLGHVIGQGEVLPAKAKTDAISNFPKPTSKKELMRFLGMSGYYRINFVVILLRL